MIIATAEAIGQSRLLKNSCQSTFPIIKVSGPPSNSGITYSPTEGIKTSIEPATTPFFESGKVMLKKVFQGGAPKSSDASTTMKTPC